MSRYLTIFGLLAAAAGGIPAMASAADSAQLRTFDVSVEGVQTTTFRYDHRKSRSSARASVSASADRARARSVAYRGRTRSGDPISFRLVGSKLTHLSAFVPTVCLATDGLPLSGTDPFNPPGAFPLGRTRQVKAKRENAIWNTSQVTKNFKVTTKRGHAGRITGKLHVDYSFLQILFTYPISSRPYVCSGDTTFRLKPRS